MICFLGSLPFDLSILRHCRSVYGQHGILYENIEDVMHKIVTYVIAYCKVRLWRCVSRDSVPFTF